MRTVTFAPLAPRTRTSGTAARLRPKSKTKRPSPTFVTDTGFSGSQSRIAGTGVRTTGAVGATTAFRAATQPAFPPPVPHQFGSSNRASYVSPW